MWQETKHGLYQKFVFADFAEAWEFMQRAKAEFERLDHHPRWLNEWNVVEMWLVTHDSEGNITDKDHTLAAAIDALLEHPNKENLNADDVFHTTINEVKLYADGGSRGNPGHSASGYVVLDMNDRVLHEEGVYLGITTNNQAEYQALKLGLEYIVKQRQARKVHVYMDSLLVINQMKKIFKVRNRDLWPVHDAITQLLPKFEQVTFEHVPRELNKAADAEVNKCLDAELNIT
ncbi:MAG TPA: reverse transcriptase-like protein [Candidatus Saccharibacteria bacterium]|nr:reverse transcriptase-like protein [Candidatus Saccharibacteria bacterium]